MRKLVAVPVLLLFLTACASSSNATAKLLKPEIRIQQISGVPAAAQHVEGGLSVQFALRVANRSEEPITLQRVSIQSLSEGAYHVNSAVPFDVRVHPGQFEIVEFWAPARTGLSLVGANGPDTLRVTTQFDSAVGKFQQIVTQVVNDRTSVTGDQ